MSTSLQASDQAAAEVASGPRVTLADIEAKVGFTSYFTAGTACRAISGLTDEVPASLDVLTLCVMVMRNGFTVIGKSAPASAENFDLEVGCRFAREDAIRQVWAFEGYLLRERLSRDGG